MNIIYVFHFSRHIIDKLLQYCEKLTDASVTAQRKIVDNATFVVPFVSDGNLVQFQKTAESFLVAKQPLKPIADVSKAEIELPDIHPLHSNISIDKENIYQKRNIYRKLSIDVYSETKEVIRCFFHISAIKNGVNFEHPHTAFVHYTPLDVKTITLEPVTEDQIASRALLKAFTVAKAQSIYGVSGKRFSQPKTADFSLYYNFPNISSSFQADVQELPKPITVQCVQVHVNRFYFGVYQLNTLNLQGDSSAKNYWFKVPPMLLYTNCEYEESRPVLRNYNNDVLRHTLAFYQNQ